MLYHTVVLLFLLSFCVFETDEQNVDAGGLEKPESAPGYFLFDIMAIHDLMRMKASQLKYTCVYVYHPTWPCFQRCEKVYRWFRHIASDMEKWPDNNVQFAKLDLDMFVDAAEQEFFRELFGVDHMGQDVVDTNPNVVCWLPGGSVFKRYPHTLDRYSKLRRFISWTASGRGFTLSNFTSWFNPVKRNYFWLPQENSGSKWVAWPKKNPDTGEYDEATVQPQHIVTGPRTSLHPDYPEYTFHGGAQPTNRPLYDNWYYTYATTFFPIMQYPWSYYDQEDHEWDSSMLKIK